MGRAVKAVIEHCDYYVYTLRVEDCTTPFYVGKGRRSRAHAHFNPGSLRTRSHKNNVIKKAWRNGKAVWIEWIKEGLTNDQASKLEIRLVHKYGRSVNGGCLTNLTDGGEGTPGRVLSKDARETLSWSQWLRKRTDEERDKISKAVSERHLDPENRKKCRRRNLLVSEETRKKISRALSGRKKPPRSVAHCAAISEAGRRRTPMSQKTRDKIALASSGRCHSDETKLKMKEIAFNRTTVKCPHCPKIGVHPMMGRWHFDNCPSLTRP